MKNHLQLNLLRLLILGSLLLFARKSHAWEFRNNPDRFPSLGFNVSSSHLTGSRSNIDLPNDPLQRVQKDSGPLDSTSFGADLRLPLSQGVTLSLAYDRLDFSSNLTREQNVFKTNDSFQGNKFSLGLRVYLNK